MTRKMLRLYMVTVLFTGVYGAVEIDLCGSTRISKSEIFIVKKADQNHDRIHCDCFIYSPGGFALSITLRLAVTYAACDEQFFIYLHGAKVFQRCSNTRSITVLDSVAPYLPAARERGVWLTYQNKYRATSGQPGYVNVTVRASNNNTVNVHCNVRGDPPTSRTTVPTDTSPGRSLTASSTTIQRTSILTSEEHETSVKPLTLAFTSTNRKPVNTQKSPVYNITTADTVNIATMTSAVSFSSPATDRSRVSTEATTDRTTVRTKRQTVTLRRSRSRSSVTKDGRTTGRSLVTFRPPPHSSTVSAGTASMSNGKSVTMLKTPSPTTVSFGSKTLITPRSKDKPTEQPNLTNRGKVRGAGGHGYDMKGIFIIVISVVTAVAALLVVAAIIIWCCRKTSKSGRKGNQLSHNQQLSVCPPPDDHHKHPIRPPVTPPDSRYCKQPEQRNMSHLPPPLPDRRYHAHPEKPVGPQGTEIMAEQPNYPPCDDRKTLQVPPVFPERNFCVQTANDKSHLTSPSFPACRTYIPQSDDRKRPHIPPPLPDRDYYRQPQENGTFSLPDGKYMAQPEGRKFSQIPPPLPDRNYYSLPEEREELAVSSVKK